MAVWLHVAPFSNAENRSGWAVIATRSHPSFEQIIHREIPAIFVRPWPHLEGWWIDQRASEHLFHAISNTTRVEDLCRQCAQEGAPCDVACVMAAARGAEYERAAAIYESTRLRDERQQLFRDQFYRNQERKVRGRNDDYAAPPPRPFVQQKDPRTAAAAILGVKLPATRSDIQKAFRIAILRAHPDVGGTDAQAIAVTRARKTLLDAI